MSKSPQPPKRSRVVGFVMLYLSGFVGIVGAVFGLVLSDMGASAVSWVIMGIALAMFVLGLYWIVNPLKIDDDSGWMRTLKTEWMRSGWLCRSKMTLANLDFFVGLRGYSKTFGNQ